MNYPTTFSEELRILTPELLEPRGTDPNRHLRQVFGTLEAAGFEVVSGMRRADLPAVSAIACTDPVREYCPDDLIRRFGDEDMTEGWYRSGKGLMLLRRIGDKAIGGYGWTAPQICQEIPDQLVTFAGRLGPLAAGRGLGAAFTTVIVDSSRVLHGAQNIGLQAWGSNTAAIRSYAKAFARLVTTRDDFRPTLNPTLAEQCDHVRPGQRRDIRLFEVFRHTFER